MRGDVVPGYCEHAAGKLGQVALRPSRGASRLLTAACLPLLADRTVPPPSPPHPGSGGPTSRAASMRRSACCGTTASSTQSPLRSRLSRRGPTAAAAALAAAAAAARRQPRRCMAGGRHTWTGSRQCRLAGFEGCMCGKRAQRSKHRTAECGHGRRRHWLSPAAQQVAAGTLVHRTGKRCCKCTSKRFPNKSDLPVGPSTARRGGSGGCASARPPRAPTDRCNAVCC